MIHFSSLQKYEEEFYQDLLGQEGVSFSRESIKEDQLQLLPENLSVLSAFVNDQLNERVLTELKSRGLKAICLRCAGFNNVDLYVAEKLGITFHRVPAYSPEAVAEYSLALLLNLTRKCHKSYVRTREHNFSLDGLVGENIFGKTVGVIGTGKIGSHFAKILKAMGARVLALDPNPSKKLVEMGIEYCDKEELLKSSHIISLHAPLNESTKYIINEEAFALMPSACFLVNTSRGGLVKTSSLIKALKSKKLAGVALDVYELEEDSFFKDLSIQGIDDDSLARIISFPEVLVSSHQAFLSREALQEIANITKQNIEEVRK